MRKKAFTYLRVSGKGQISGDGFPRQRETVQKFAKKNQIEIVREFRDEGVSGTKDAFDRDGLTDLLVAIKSNGVRTVLVERADRLARDLMVSEILLDEFRKLEVTVIEAESGLDLTVHNQDPTRVLMRQMLAAISQWEKSCIVQKLRASRVRIRKTKGKCEGRKPFGESKEEYAVVQRIRALRASGLTIKAIADSLNSENIPTQVKVRSGTASKWHATMISRILSRNFSIVRPSREGLAPH
jgi:DNA invertase Pin-like site-specific DNA recombinase